MSEQRGPRRGWPALRVVAATSVAVGLTCGVAWALLTERSFSGWRELSLLTLMGAGVPLSAAVVALGQFRRREPLVVAESLAVSIAGSLVPWTWHGVHRLQQSAVFRIEDVIGRSGLDSLLEIILALLALPGILAVPAVLGGSALVGSVLGRAAAGGSSRQIRERRRAARPQDDDLVEPAARRGGGRWPGWAGAGVGLAGGIAAFWEAAQANLYVCMFVANVVLGAWTASLAVVWFLARKARREPTGDVG